MSFHNIRGKIYNCRECGCCFAIEFKDGPNYGNISMRSIEKNIELLDSEYDFEKFGYYYHNEIICDRCLNDKYKDEDKKVAIFSQEDTIPYDMLLFSIKEMEEMISELITLKKDKYVKTLDLTKFGIELEKNLSDAERKEVVEDKKQHIVDDFFHLISKSDPYKDIVDYHDKSIKKHKDHLREIMRGNLSEFFVELDLEGTINLKPCFCETQKDKFEGYLQNKYYEGPIPIQVEEFRKYLCRCNLEEFIKDKIRANELLIRKIEDKIKKM